MVAMGSQNIQPVVYGSLTFGWLGGWAVWSFVCCLVGWWWWVGSLVVVVWWIVGLLCWACLASLVLGLFGIVGLLVVGLKCKRASAATTPDLT